MQHIAGLTQVTHDNAAYLKADMDSTTMSSDALKDLAVKVMTDVVQVSGCGNEIQFRVGSLDPKASDNSHNLANHFKAHDDARMAEAQAEMDAAKEAGGGKVLIKPELVAKGGEYSSNKLKYIKKTLKTWFAEDSTSVTGTIDGIPYTLTLVTMANKSHEYKFVMGEKAEGDMAVGQEAEDETETGVQDLKDRLATVQAERDALTEEKVAAEAERDTLAEEKATAEEERDTLAAAKTTEAATLADLAEEKATVEAERDTLLEEKVAAEAALEAAGVATTEDKRVADQNFEAQDRRLPLWLRRLQKIRQFRHPGGRSGQQ